MLTGGRLKEKSKIFAKKYLGIAHPHRMAIVYLLAHDPLWVRDIVMHLNVPENLIAFHLRQMHRTGWVTKIKEGRHTEYRLNEKAFFELARFLSDTPFERNVLSKYSR